MPLKVVLEFEMEGYGWSEVHYVIATGLADFVPSDNQWLSGPSAAANLGLVRRGCLVSAARMTHIRVSNLAVPGEFLSHEYDGSVNNGDYIVFNHPDVEAETFESILVNLQAGYSSRRKLYVAGIPDDVVGGSQTYKPDAAWRNALGLYLETVSKAPYAVRTRKPLLPDNPKDLLSFDISADGRNATTLSIPDNFPATLPGYVILRGMKWPRGWGGVHPARRSPAGGTLRIGPTKRTLPSLPEWNQNAGGTVQTFIPNYVALTRYDTIRIVSRKRGRPFGKSRGRR